MSEKIIKFLQSQELIPTDTFEKKCEIKTGVLRHAIKGRKPLPKKYLPKIKEVLSKLSADILEAIKGL